MKKVIGKFLKKLYSVSPEQVIQTIEKADCKAVSFDIFDTLLKRNVSAPTDVFLLLEKHYQRKFGGNRKISRLRSEAEKRAVQQTGHRDVSHWEIYQAVEEISKVERKWLMAEEIRIEQTVCLRWQSMGQAYDWCIAHDIPVLLISDMYLSNEVITELLHVVGYKGWKHLYVSAQEKASKAEGTLFDIVLNKEQLKPGELIHIGDSLWGDYLMPREKGISSILVADRL